MITMSTVFVVLVAVAMITVLHRESLLAFTRRVLSTHRGYVEIPITVSTKPSIRSERCNIKGESPRNHNESSSFVVNDMTDAIEFTAPATDSVDKRNNMCGIANVHRSGKYHEVELL